MAETIQLEIVEGNDVVTLDITQEGRGPAGTASVNQALITAAITNKATFASDNSLAPSAHTHLSADVTDATTDGDTNTQKLLKTDANGKVTVRTVAADKLALATDNGPPLALGETTWDQDEETLSTYLKSGVILRHGENLLYHVENNTVSNIAKGVPVMYAGTVGGSGKLRAKPWDGTATKAFLGFAAAQLDANGGTGYVLDFGKLKGIQTNGANYGETWVTGDIIYAITGSANLTKTQPSAGGYSSVAVVINAHASNGTLFVRPTEVPSLSDLGAAASSHTHVSADITDAVDSTGTAHRLLKTDANGKLATLSMTTGALGTITSTDGINPVFVTVGFVSNLGDTATTFPAAGGEAYTENNPPPTLSHASTHATGGDDALTPADIGAQPAGSYATLAGSETLTNKRTPPRVTTITSSATPTVNTDNCDMVTITALAEAITSMTSGLTGTPNNGEMLLYRIKDNGTGRAITWGASFVAMGASLPTTTVLSKVMHVLFVWDSVTSKWGCISTAYEI